MPIPDSAVAHPLLTPTAKVRWTQPEATPLAGLPTPHLLQVMNQLISYITGTSRMIVCNLTGTNDLELATLRGGPQVGQFGTAGYVDFEVYSAVAEHTSTGAVTAYVLLFATSNAAARALGTLKVFKQNGAVQADAGDLVAGLHYTFTYVDSLDSGNGGFVLR